MVIRLGGGRRDDGLARTHDGHFTGALIHSRYRSGTTSVGDRTIAVRRCGVRKARIAIRLFDLTTVTHISKAHGLRRLFGDRKGLFDNSRIVAAEAHHKCCVTSRLIIAVTERVVRASN